MSIDCVRQFEEIGQEKSMKRESLGQQLEQCHQLGREVFGFGEVGSKRQQSAKLVEVWRELGASRATSILYEPLIFQVPQDQRVLSRFPDLLDCIAVCQCDQPLVGFVFVQGVSNCIVRKVVLYKCGSVS